MALTQLEEQRLHKAGLIVYFDTHRAPFESAAKGLLDFLKTNFPPHSTVRPDDVAKSLLGVVEVDQGLQNFLAKKKLKQQYWAKYFTNLILDRVWATIN